MGVGIESRLIGAGAGGGAVTPSGTPVSGQVAYFSGATTITGQPNFTWDGSILGVKLGIQLNNAGTSAATSEIYNGVTDGRVLYEGGSGSSNSGIVACYGSTHATLANIVDIMTGTTVNARFSTLGLGLLSGAATATAPFAVQKSADALVQGFLYNPNAGSSAVARFSIRTNADDFDMTVQSTAAGATVTLNSGAGLTGGLTLAAASTNPVTVKNNAATTAVFNTNGLQILTGSTSSISPFSVRKDINAVIQALITNASNGAAAQTKLKLTGDGGDFEMIAQSLALSATCLLATGSGYTGGLRVDVGGSASFKVYTNNTKRLDIGGAGVWTFENGEKLQYIAGELSFTKADDSRCITMGAGGSYFDVHAGTAMRVDSRAYFSNGVTAYTYLSLEMDGDPGAASAGTIRIGSKATTASGNTIHLRTEQAVEAIGVFVAANKGRIWWNNVEYWVQLDPV